MATPKAALQRMRDICLALPNTSEAEHFGEVCFRVGKRIFASCGEKNGVCRVVVQLEAKHASELLQADSRFQRYARQKDCVWFNAADVNDLDEIRALVLESYRLNESAKPARPRKRKKRSS